MSTRRDHDRSISAWLIAEAPDRAPDDVLEASRERIRTTRQRSALWSAWRFNVSNPVRYAIAAAAVLVVALIGYQLLPGDTGPIVGTPSQAPTASPAPSPTPVPRIPSGAIVPGRYGWVPTPGGRLTFEVPAGWQGSVDGTGIGKNEDQPGEIGLWEWYFDGFQVNHVYADACLPPETLIPIGPTVADLVTALERQGSINAVVTDITVAGLPAKRIVLTEPDGLDRATCRHGADGPLQIWADSGIDNYFSLPPGYVGIAYVLDPGSARMVFQASYADDASPTDVAQLDAIVASMRLE